MAKSNIFSASKTSLLLAITMAALRVNVAFSSTEIPQFPRNRFVPWDALGWLTKEDATYLFYTEATWNNFLAASLERMPYKQAAEALGLNDVERSAEWQKTNSALQNIAIDGETWDCWIHHYVGNSWVQLRDEHKVSWAFEALGWTEDTWQSENSEDWPESEQQTYDQLTPEQQRGADRICLPSELWNGIPLSEWEFRNGVSFVETKFQKKYKNASTTSAKTQTAATSNSISSPANQPPTATNPTLRPTTRSPTLRPTTNRAVDVKELQVASEAPSAYVRITDFPTHVPSVAPSVTPTDGPSSEPTLSPTTTPSLRPSRSMNPTQSASSSPSKSMTPSASPSASPSAAPSVVPSDGPSAEPSIVPTPSPSASPSASPSVAPSDGPSAEPSTVPSASPSVAPSDVPSMQPSADPTTFYEMENSKCNTNFTLVLVTDKYPKETTWTLTLESIDLVIGEGSGYQNDFETHEEDVCIGQNACYMFEIKDKWDDGICCSNGQGSYSGYIEKAGMESIAIPGLSGGAFESSRKHKFCLDKNGDLVEGEGLGSAIGVRFNGGLRGRRDLLRV